MILSACLGAKTTEARQRCHFAPHSTLDFRPLTLVPVAGRLVFIRVHLWLTDLW
jgi:hypothetical protein